MIPSIIHFVQTTLVPLGSLGIFLTAMLGEMVGPLPAISLIAGAGLSVFKHLTFSPRLFGEILVLIALPDAFGSTVGSFVTYGLGYFGGKPVIEKFGKYMGVSWHKIEKIHDRLLKTEKDEWFLFFIRAMPLFPSIAINIVCGLIRMPKTKYAVATFWGTLVRVFIYAFIGWSLGGAYRNYTHYFGRFERSILLAIIVSVIIYICWLIYNKNKDKKLI